mmetsp:Transcript_4869/g.11104  ORF Transcript_4869/g.11104 Transcript_4869/m.11104 type:complete len:556 (-) Transcript_4869:163-1830(-)|eukprot:CAMPEP_0172297484 /NCGR_PEP_ID=MMETSP1058-20130122/486_1 /TAXON_ID=83371 /ORGANISM="Detonula confervacea, Strain CCMP 353" /LENGTH=555 /DNA_ID=CAMNT_0013006641 /DNA_START=109 /DNA_END=1776 /DNA_ORIENTATION=+
MVKFSFLALASAVATASASSNGQRIVKKTINLGDRNLRRGDPSTEALLKKAMPYKKKSGAKKIGGARRLDEEAEEFEIDGSYSLQFSECVDIKTYDEDLFDEDIISYVQAGQIVAVKSYVIFHVCTDSTCYLDGEDDLFIVDLATYMTNVATYHANVKTDYCEQCEQFEDYCNPEEEEVEEEEEEADEEEEEGDEEEEDNEDEEEGEEDNEEDENEEEGDEDEEDRRKLKKTKRNKTKRKLTTRKGAKKLSLKAIERKLAQDPEYIDCNQCATYECYAEENENEDENEQQNQENLDEAVSEWIVNVAGCVETGVQWNNLDLYVGAMCSPYGDGVELAVFANDECTWYTNQKRFSQVYNYANDANGENENNVNYMTYAENFIKSAFSEVTPCLQKEYSDPDEEADENNNEDEEEQKYEVNQYCQGVMEENVVSLSNCAAEEQDEEEEEEDENAVNYSWFTYDMKEADDVNEVCATINKMESADYSHVYDEDMSGSWYTRNKKGAIVQEGESEGLSGGAIAAIVAVVAGVLGAAGFFLMKAKTDKPMDADYQGGEMS